MNFDNPTSIRLGMTATFAGIRYRVIGRVVMGMDEGGETYYWTEFNVVNDSGKPAILVFERTEKGPEWRLFTLFEPQWPMTAAEAAGKHAGDKVNFDGTPLRITLVDESRVYFIEGEAPEGVEVGDVAKYFNAVGANKMFVASWTGEEIEFYRGMNLSTGAVKNAFGLGSVLLQNYIAEQNPERASLPWTVPVFLLVFMAMIMGSLISSCEPPMQARVVKQPLPAPPVVLGRNVQLNGKVFGVKGYADVETAEVGRRYEWHEYYLSDINDAQLLLIYGLKPGSKEWFLFTASDSAPMSAGEAASYRRGDSIRIDGSTMKVREIVYEKIDRTEGTGTPTQNAFYGFLADAESGPLLARWNEDGVAFYKGRRIAEKEIRTLLK